MTGVVPLTLLILECPPEQVSTVRNLLLTYEVDTNPMGPVTAGFDPDRMLALRSPYQDTTAAPGTASVLATDLTRRAPEVAFKLWQDPCAENLGELFAYVPDLGPWDGQCDSDGEPYVRVRDALDLAGTFTAAMLARVAELEQRPIENVAFLPGAPCYVLLRVDDPAEARMLLEDLAEYPDHALLTPCQENVVHAQVAYIGDDDGDHGPSMADLVGRSYEQVRELRDASQRQAAEHGS
jgi:hypothetical protein